MDHVWSGTGRLEARVTRRQFAQAGALVAAAATGWSAASVLPQGVRDRAGAALGLSAAAHLRRSRWTDLVGGTVAVAGIGALRVEGVEALPGAKDADGAFLVRFAARPGLTTAPAGTYAVRHPGLGAFALHLRPAVGRRRYVATIARGGR